MDTQMQAIRLMIENGETGRAIEVLNGMIAANARTDDEPYYLLGNAYRKTGDWQRAMNNYLEAMDRNPESPAAEAHAMLVDILDFHNKDMYNQ